MVDAIGFHGKQEDGDLIVVLAMETPIRATNSARGLAKEAVERVHLERYRSDYLTATGNLPFDRVLRGDEPPDFFVETGEHRVALDCASFMMRERRHGYALFERVRRLVRTAASKGRLSHLENCVLFIWFDQGNGLPPRGTDREKTDALMQTILNCRIGRARLIDAANRMSREGLPQQMDQRDVAIFWTPNRDAGFQVVPVDPNPVDPFGISCQLRMATFVTLSQTRAELMRLIKKHDNPKTEHLLVTLGGPDFRGLRYPAEEQLVDLVIESTNRGLVATNLKNLSVHCWTSGVAAADLPFSLA